MNNELKEFSTKDTYVKSIATDITVALSRNYKNNNMKVMTFMILITDIR